MTEFTVFVIGDTHFRSKFIETGNLLVQKCIEYVEEYNPNMIVLLGDILHSHADTKQPEFDLAQNFITRLAEYAPTYVLIGNHDYINNSQFLSSQHFFNALKNSNNITIVDRCIHVAHRSGDSEFDFVFCPFVQSSRFIEALGTCFTTIPHTDYDYANRYSWRYARCIFSHIDIAGAIYSNKTLPKDATKWSKKYPFLVSGHIHKNQRLKNVYYPGSSTQVSIDEDPNKIVALIKFCDENYDIVELSLNIPGVYQIKCNIQQTTDTNLDKYIGTHKIKMRITATTAEYDNFIKTKKYRKLIKKGIIVEIDKIPDDIVETLNVGSKFSTFHDIFNDLVKKKEQSSSKRIFISI